MTRDDLFTHIHKALRLGLFEVTTLAGSTDWSDPAEVRRFDERWPPLLALLQAHTRHEDDHILRILDPHGGTEATGEQHHDLDDLLEHVAATVDAAVADPSLERGLDAYRDLARFVAAYLPHLHEEETVVMPRIWERCTDAEIAAIRAAFMAEMTPAETASSMRLMLPALDKATRAELVGRLAATAPAPVVEGVLAIAAEALPAAAAAELRANIAVAAA